MKTRTEPALSRSFGRTRIRRMESLLESLSVTSHAVVHDDGAPKVEIDRACVDFRVYDLVAT